MNNCYSPNLATQTTNAVHVNYVYIIKNASTKFHLVFNGCLIAWCSRIFESQLIANVVDDIQCIVQLLFGVGSRQTEAYATGHNWCGRKSDADRGNFSRWQRTNDGTAKKWFCLQTLFDDIICDMVIVVKCVRDVEKGDSPNKTICANTYASFENK